MKVVLIQRYVFTKKAIHYTIFFYFLKVLNKQVDEAGNSDGYSSRVKYLEKLNFETGALKGMMEIVLESWENIDKGKNMSSNYYH